PGSIGEGRGEIYHCLLCSADLFAVARGVDDWKITSSFAPHKLSAGQARCSLAKGAPTGDRRAIASRGGNDRGITARRRIRDGLHREVAPRRHAVWTEGTRIRF